jgi:hypothetical protein
MGNGVFAVNQGTLERLAGRLRDGADDLDQPAAAMPKAPDAGGSTPAVSAAMAEIARAIIGINETMQNIAANVTQGRGQYHEVDESNAADIQGQLPH